MKASEDYDSIMWKMDHKYAAEKPELTEVAEVQ